MWLFLFLTLIPTEVFFLIRDNELGRHEIYATMFDARVKGDRWLRKASESASLQRAVVEYRLRHHGRNPPPKFDVWYNYALEKGSPIIDDYDSIDRDLLITRAVQNNQKSFWYSELILIIKSFSNH